MSVENTHLGAEKISELLKNCKSIFFIGVGGINMSSLAHISSKRGFRVGGSDRTMTDITNKLSSEGIEVFCGHSARNVDNYDAVVYTVAISPDNPEYARAIELGLPTISRADYLGYVMTGYKRRIGVSGMHGKSTCTSMCAEALIRGGADPTVLSGAELSIMNGAYTVGGEDNFLFEACEYMDSFLDFNPSVAVVLNIEMDHVDYFKSMEQIRSSYSRFADKTGKDGYAIYNCDDDDVIEALAEYGGNRITFGIDNVNADLCAENIVETNGRYSFDVIADGEFYIRIELSVTGRHNIYNALATVAVCRLCGLSKEKIIDGIKAFSGARRRMEYKGKLNGARIYDDYGHHPTEVATTLMGARGLVKDNCRLFCVFQPHTYSRTKALFDDFAGALSIADRAIIANIYAARETDTLGVSASLLAERIGESAAGDGELQKIADRLSSELKEGDVCVVMGAGDVYKLFGMIDLLGEE